MVKPPSNVEVALCLGGGVVGAAGVAEAMTLLSTPLTTTIVGGVPKTAEVVALGAAAGEAGGNDILLSVKNTVLGHSL